MNPDKPELKVDFCTHKAAQYACLNYHYSKTIPTPPINKVGVWENNSFIGVVLFSRGASSNLSKPYNLKNTEVCELTRIALKKHFTPVSQIISQSIWLLKKKSPKMRLIISFADPNQGHHGGIYQATNWIYTGQTKGSSAHVDRKGKIWHSRQVSEKGFNIQYGEIRRCLKPSELTQIKLEGKHRYLMPLDKKMRKEILHLSQPYPKRTPVGAVVIPSHQGGSIPTCSLQI